MKKATIITLLLIMICSCAFVFVACDSANDIVGTWRGYGLLTFNKDHTGTKDFGDKTTTFTWKFKNKTAKTDNDNSKLTTFTYILINEDNSKNEIFTYVCKVDNAENTTKYVSYEDSNYYKELPDKTDTSDIVGKWVCQDYDYAKNVYVSRPKYYFTINFDGTFSDSYGTEYGTWSYDTKWRVFKFDVTDIKGQHIKNISIMTNDDGTLKFYWFLNYFFKQ